MGIIKRELFGKQVNAVAILFKVLGHPCRLTLIKILLTEGPKTNGELVDRVGLAQSTVSEHLRLLRELNIVRTVPHENTIHYYVWDVMWNEVKETIRVYLDGGDREIEI